MYLCMYTYTYTNLRFQFVTPIPIGQRLVRVPCNSCRRSKTTGSLGSKLGSTVRTRWEVTKCSGVLNHS